MRRENKDFDTRWWKQSARTVGCPKIENKKIATLSCAVAVALIFSVTASMASEGIETLPGRICFVVREDGDIAHRVRLVSDISTYASFEIVYKPEAVQVNGLDGLNYPGTHELDLVLQVPEGTYEEIKELYNALIEERARGLGMKGRKASKRGLPSMRMSSRLEIRVLSSGVDMNTITIPLEVVYDFSEKTKTTSWVYVE
jgi:hypothetical protein